MFRRSRDFFTDILRQTDLVLLALCAAASLFGILMVASATRYMHTWRLVAVQSAALLLGVILYLLVSQVDLNDLSKYWKWIFLTGMIFILLLVTPLGIEDNTGNRAWLDFPFLPVKVQPAEIVKLTFTLVLAKQLAWLKENRDLSSIPSILFLGVHFGVIFLLYYKVSSDMGSALVFLFIFICMCFIAGVALHWFAIGGVLGGVGFWALWDLNKMPKYMKLRFQVLFDHTLDVQNTGWQQTRSLMALGSGKLTGEGLFHGTQTQSEYSSALPNRHTDFIFTVIGEELGIVGCTFVLLLLAVIVARCIYVGVKSGSYMNRQVCIGMAGMLIWQIIINVGMCVGLTPVIGLTLPFISYGGSSIVSTFIIFQVIQGLYVLKRGEEEEEENSSEEE